VRLIAALFIDTIELRQAAGPSTRIDLGGVKFSEVAPGPFPVTIEPHLVVLVHCPVGEKGEAALEATYHRGGEELARNVQLLAVEPGKFNYRLIRAELTFDEPGTVEAHVRLDQGEPIVVPFTLLPPVGG
jgi:hypothetical protein